MPPNYPRWSILDEEENTYKILPDFLEELCSGFSEVDKLKIKEAYRISIEAHAGQKRKSWEAYIIHIRDVLKKLKEHNEILGETATSEDIIVALLHDSLEDHPEYFGQILETFEYTILVRILWLSKPSKALFGLWSSLNHQSDSEEQLLLYWFWKAYVENTDNTNLTHKVQSLQRVVFNHYSDSDEKQNIVLGTIVDRWTIYTQQVNDINHLKLPPQEREELLQKRWQEFAAELQLLLNWRANAKIKIADKSSNLQDTAFHQRTTSKDDRINAKRKSRSILLSIPTYRIVAEIHWLKKLLRFLESDVHKFHASLALIPPDE